MSMLGGSVSVLLDQDVASTNKTVPPWEGVAQVKVTVRRKHII